MLNDAEVWVAVESETGETYYFNEVTGETQWTNPVADSDSDSDAFSSTGSGDENNFQLGSPQIAKVKTTPPPAPGSFKIRLQERKKREERKDKQKILDL